MRKGGNIITLGESLEAQLPRILESLPIGVQLERVQDQPKVVASSVQEFLKVLAEAIAIVLGVSLIALGLHSKPLRLDPRPGLIVAISIPLVLAVTFLVMNIWGVGIHKISLGSLIIALGLLVDDAIIVVEMMVRKLEEGASRLEAATAAYDLTAMPMLTGTLITAVGFLPIGIAESAVGEYTFAIFAVTAAALLVSWLVSVIFVPSLGYWMLRAPRARHAHTEEAQFEGGFYRAFRLILNGCVRRPLLVLLLTVLTFVAGIMGMGKVEQQFFPDSSRPEILVDFTLAEGTGMSETEAVAKRLEAVALSVEGVGSVTNWIGSGAPRFFMPLDVIFPQANVGQMIILTKPGANRQAIVKALSEQLVQVAPEARIRAKLLPNGPPVPYPVQIRLVADHIDTLRQAQPLVEPIMRQHPDLIGLHSNWNQSRPVAKVDLDLARARELGVSPLVVAQSLKARFSGVLVGEFRDEDKLLPIEMKLPASERDQLADLRELLLSSQSGALVPLEKIASIALVWEPGILWRKDRRFAMTLQGTVREGRQGPSVQAEIMQQLQPVIAKLPVGVEIEVGGETEESGKGQASIFKGLPIMLFITFTLLVLQLQSTPRSLMVLATAPLGIAGVAAALLLLDRPFGFVAMLGVIALMGMIMRNSVILIDQIERERSAGRPILEAIVEATVRRFRPITLTAAAAVLAMIPLQGSVFWGPMAVAIMGGLVVATLLTLLSLPALYALFVRERRLD
jgi:multidrug efflux pump subunit AcrB